jgi:transposase
MPKKIDYQLSEEELTVVRRAIVSDRRPEVRHRAMAIHLLHQGTPKAAVAKMLAVGVSTAYKWHTRWREAGLDGLANQAKSGRKRKADEAYWERVAQLMEQEPREVGYDFTIWTTKRLIAHMAQETGIELSISRFRAVLKERGYVYRRPKHDLKSLQDPDARAAAEEWLAGLKKKPLPARSTSSLWTKQP